MIKSYTDYIFPYKRSPTPKHKASSDESKDDIQDHRRDEGPPEPEEILPLVMKELTPALLREAREQLNETEEIKREALEELRQLIKTEEKLVTPTDDLFLLTFLRARAFDVKRSFRLLQRYWKFRKDYDAIFRDSDTDVGDAVFARNFVGLLSHRDRNGCAVFVVRIGLWDPDEFSYETMFRCVTAILVYSQQHEATQVAGFRAIFDFRGLSWKHMKYVTPSNCLLLIRSTQFCYPARYKGVHVLCENKSVNFLWSVLYSVLPTKLKHLIFFHGEDLTPLRKYIHPSVLPVEFGGEGPPFTNDIMMETLKDKNNHVLKQLHCGYQD